MALEEYKRKRKFILGGTPEPKPSVKETRKRRFVVQKHQATHLHYDFRLEIGGVLKSWAVPKGLPEKPGIKRLAIEVEDHPVDYINFEGVIPEGLYGAGKVEIWDSGIYEKLKILPRGGQNSKMNELEFILKGKKLKGNYAMIKMKGLKNKKSWLIFKR